MEVKPKRVSRCSRLGSNNYQTYNTSYSVSMQANWISLSLHQSGRVRRPMPSSTSLGPTRRKCKPVLSVCSSFLRRSVLGLMAVLTRPVRREISACRQTARSSQSEWASCKSANQPSCRSRRAKCWRIEEKSVWSEVAVQARCAITPQYPAMSPNDSAANLHAFRVECCHWSAVHQDHWTQTLCDWLTPLTVHSKT